MYKGRVELLVTDPSTGEQVFAPLCGMEDLGYAQEVAKLACKQIVDWPYVGMDVEGWPDEPVAVPAEPEASDDGAFRPSRYPVWAALPEGEPTDGLVALQQLGPRLSGEPCATLFTLHCNYMA
ncbi:hypothetical protein HYH03_005027 [Edaphochlamys debaryana]|uniref:Uncharacterized protein n=1 Tax=Edaphochlamys debaryana TaxID=47281 RepID=A0A835Y8E8_9CHLO|nr:hypothetical protein HYH03_005027 [Edaphochlamys debaryana]|eukprot:KAG2497024.1 hypothetical protein HYH03_005027 [Edaphochlamys debaryana]